MDEKLKNRLSDLLYRAWYASYYDEMGASIHPREEYSPKTVKEIAEELGIDTTEWE